MKRRKNVAPLPTIHSSSSTMEGTTSSYFPTADTAFRTINGCMQELLNMQHGFLQMESSVSQGKSVVKEQQELLRIKSSVVYSIEMLFRGTQEGGQYPRPTSPSPPSVMEGTSSSYFPTIKIALRAITECFQEFLKMQELISLSQGESLDTELLHIKSSVVLRLKMLFKESEEADDEAMDVDVEGQDYESSDEYEDEIDPAACGSRGLGSLPASNPVQVEKSCKLRFKKEDHIWSSVKEKESSIKERYLCVSNGFQIWCLDLRQSCINDSSAPRIATLDLLGGHLPASVGLFKLKSDAYMIGGQMLPDSVKDTGYSIFYTDVPMGNDLYHTLCESEGVKGSSRVTYRLSLAADKEDGSLSLSHPEAACSDIEELTKPKVWPIVEKIGEKLHVMDSVPFGLGRCRPDWTFTHEVRNLDGSGGWKEIIPTIERTVHIISHVVVGNRIFAKTNSNRAEFYFLEFDSKTEKWKACTQIKLFDVFEPRRVWNILPGGIARCAGEYHHLHPQLPHGERLYVVVALVQKADSYPDYGYVNRTLAVAYLVTSTGLVLCYQRLPHFFTGPFLPCHMGGGTIINVEEDKEWGTMCSVLSATLMNEKYRLIDHLLINTFSVELLPDVSDKVDELLVKKASELEAEAEDGAPVELEFVRLVPKDWYIFQPDGDTDFGIMGRYSPFLGWQACFLTPP